MKWTEPTNPKADVSNYDHCTTKTPIGEFIIEWKSWKDFPDYDVSLNGKWLFMETSLDLAKNRVKEYMEKVVAELIDFATNNLTNGESDGQETHGLPIRQANGE